MSKRNYEKEYANESDARKKKRVNRNLARRIMKRKGLVKKGDKKEQKLLVRKIKSHKGETTMPMHGKKKTKMYSRGGAGMKKKTKMYARGGAGMKKKTKMYSRGGAAKRR